MTASSTDIQSVTGLHSLPNYTAISVPKDESSSAGKTLIPNYINIFYYVLSFIIYIMY